jgi:hypothetical protein
MTTQVRRAAGWGGFGVAVVLVAGSVAGMVAMARLAERADEVRIRACAAGGDARPDHWEKGFDAWLPIVTATTAVLAVLILVAVIAVGRVTLLGRVGVLSLVPVLWLALSTGWLVHEFYAYPGADISTVGSFPCGGG